MGQEVDWLFAPVSAFEAERVVERWNASARARAKARARAFAAAKWAAASLAVPETVIAAVVLMLTAVERSSAHQPAKTSSAPRATAAVERARRRQPAVQRRVRVWRGEAETLQHTMSK